MNDTDHLPSICFPLFFLLPRLQYLMDQLGEGVLEETEGMEGWEPLHRYVASLKREESQTAANIGEKHNTHYVAVLN